MQNKELITLYITYCL